jgi:SAM-dependent methyltransferase
MKVEQCRSCAGRDLRPFLDLGETALANRFLRPDQLGEPEPRYPLRAVLCCSCGLVQIDEEVPPDVLFDHYIYVSGTSDLIPLHAHRLARDLTEKYGLGPTGLVLEAASNDGTVLRAFQQRGQRVLGIEPAKNIAAMALEQGIETVAEYFDERLAGALVRSHGRARIFLARHVLAHVAGLWSFVRGIKTVLANDGVAVIECPHLAALHDRLEFDTIYHEHLCYFSLGVLRTLFARFGLAVIDVELAEVHGGSLIVHVTHEERRREPSARVDLVLERERKLGLTEMETWQRFAGRVAAVREELLHFFREAARYGQFVVGYGASAKANTLLAYCDLGPKQLPYIVDKNPWKQGLLTPGQHIPVVEPERLLRDQPDIALVLAWNFVGEIMKQQEEFRKRGGRFAVPIPEPGLFGAVAA